MLLVFDKLQTTLWFFLFDQKFIPDFEVRYDAQNNLDKEKNDECNMILEGQRFLDKDEFYQELENSEDSFNDSLEMDEEGDNQ